MTTYDPNLDVELFNATIEAVSSDPGYVAQDEPTTLASIATTFTTLVTATTTTTTTATTTTGGSTTTSEDSSTASTTSDWSSSTKPPPPDDGELDQKVWIGIIVGATFLVILLVSVAAFLIIRTQRRKQEGRYRPATQEQIQRNVTRPPFTIPLPQPERLIWKVNLWLLCQETLLQNNSQRMWWFYFVKHILIASVKIFELVTLLPNGLWDFMLWIYGILEIQIYGH